MGNTLLTGCRRCGILQQPTQMRAERVISPMRVVTLEPMIRPGAGSGSLAPSTTAMWKAELDLSSVRWTRGGAGHDVYLSLLFERQSLRRQASNCAALGSLDDNDALSRWGEESYIFGWRV